MEKNVLVGGTVINTHEAGTCLGEFCTIHNHSDHHMAKWKQSWLEAERYMVRSCPHGESHPDPDEVNKHNIPLNHGCDGCCKPESQFTDDFRELVREYKKPDYLTPTSLGVSTGSYVHVFPEPIPGTLESLDRLVASVRKSDGRDAEELK